MTVSVPFYLLTVALGYRVLDQQPSRQPANQTKQSGILQLTVSSRFTLFPLAYFLPISYENREMVRFSEALSLYIQSLSHNQPFSAICKIAEVYPLKLVPNNFFSNRNLMNRKNIGCQFMYQIS